MSIRSGKAGKIFSALPYDCSDKIVCSEKIYAFAAHSESIYDKLIPMLKETNQPSIKI